MCLLWVMAHMWAAIWKYMHSRPNFLLSRCPPTRTPITATAAVVSVEEGCHAKIMRRIPWNYRGSMWTEDEPSAEISGAKCGARALCYLSDKTVHLEPSLIHRTSLRMMLRGCWTASPLFIPPTPTPTTFLHPDQFDKLLQENSTSAEDPSVKPWDKKLRRHFRSPALTYNHDTWTL